MIIEVHEKEDVTNLLKVGNIVFIKYDNYWNTGSHEECVHAFKIISELKKIVYLDDGKSLAKPNGRPYNFCGTLVKIQTKD